MSVDYEDYEEQCGKIREENARLLKIFEEDMAGLKPATINRHLDNVDFYINSYLLYEDAQSFAEGAYQLDGYLGEFFIRKCMWSTPGSIKTTAASIKKFYKCMLAHGEIHKEDYDFLCKTIKENMEEWQAVCAMYNDPDEDNPFSMLFDFF